VRDAGRDHGFYQASALRGVVVIVLEGLLDGFRHDDRTREVHHGADLLLGEDPREQIDVRDIASVERHALRNGELEPRAQIVDHRDRPSRVEQGQHRMAADIAGPAGNEDGNAHPRQPPRAGAGERDGGSHQARLLFASANVLCCTAQCGS